MSDARSADEATVHYTCNNGGFKKHRSTNGSFGGGWLDAYLHGVASILWYAREPTPTRLPWFQIGIIVRNDFKVICSIVLVVFASLSHAQNERETYQLRGVVTEAWRSASDLSSQLEEDLSREMPMISGWSCNSDMTERSSMPGAVEAIPVLILLCEHPEQAMRVTLILDPSSAKLQCEVIESTKSGIANERVKPDLYQFFSSGDWDIMRGSVDLKGCAFGVLALTALGGRSQAEIDAGPSSIDRLAEGMLAFDVAEVLGSETFAQQQILLKDFVDGLEIQARYLARMIPLPADSPSDIVKAVPSSEPTPWDLPLPSILAFAPFASATLEVGDCRVIVELSASEVTIEQAMRTDGRWARPGGTDGEVNYAFIRRNTERFVGRERVDGTGIEAFVDSRVIVRVVIPGATPCESDPDIVARLFRDIMTNDLSTFGIR